MVAKTRGAVNWLLSSAEPAIRLLALVDAPLLLWCGVAHQVAKSSSIDGDDRLNEDASLPAKEIDLWAKRCRAGAEGCRGHQNYRARQEFVGLDDDAISAATLFVSCSAGQAELVDVTPLHACSP